MIAPLNSPGRAIRPIGICSLNFFTKLSSCPLNTPAGEIQYTRRPIPLSSATGTSATTSNYFSEFAYNALFNACMIESAKFTKSWTVIPAWESSYQNSIDALRNQARRMRQDDMETPRNPVGGPNTVIQGAQ